LGVLHGGMIMGNWVYVISCGANGVFRLQNAFD